MAGAEPGALNKKMRREKTTPPHLKEDVKPDVKTGVKKRKKALGRGLDSLIPAPAPPNEGDKRYFECPINLIRPNQRQPRMRFSDDDLESLSLSIREQGVIQPLIVRKDEAGYELVAGERRLRAAKKAGLAKVPVVVKTISDKGSLEISIVENIQREDLNPIEESDAYHQLMTEFGFTQEQVSERVGKSRSAVANFLRLRQLPDLVKETIIDGSLSMGHARALLGADNSARLLAAWRLTISKKMTVRQTEALIKRLNNGDVQGKKTEKGPDEIHFSRLAEDLSRHFGARVQINRHGKKGKVEIDFYDNDDLDRLVNLLNRRDSHV